MPYINVSATEKLTEEQKDRIKKGLGEKISLIPGKGEETLMVDVSGEHTIYMAGERKPLAYFDVKIYGTAPFEAKKAFTEAAFQVVADATGIPAKSMYMTYAELENWGTRGSLK